MKKFERFPEGCKVVASIYAPDNKFVRRTWKERLFTRPWKPFTRTKSVEANWAYYLKDLNTAIVTFRTAALLEKEGFPVAYGEVPASVVETTRMTSNNSMVRGNNGVSVT